MSPRQYAATTDIDSTRVDGPAPSTSGRMNPPRRARGSRPLLPTMRDHTIPTPHEQRLESAIDELLDISNQSDIYLRTQLQMSVQTLDTVIYEHDTQELPVTASDFTLKLEPQTRQLELITGIYAAIVNPVTGAAATIDINNAYLKLASQYVNLNAILNSSGGTGGFLPGNYSFVLFADSPRELYISATADWPADAYVSFALFGVPIPATFGDVLT